MIMNNDVRVQISSLSQMQKVVRDKVVIVRGVEVIIDADVADLYGVATKRINEAVKNNLEKFPSDYMFPLTSEELSDLRSKFSTAKISAKNRAVPKAFTERAYICWPQFLRVTMLERLHLQLSKRLLKFGI